MNNTNQNTNVEIATANVSNICRFLLIRTLGISQVMQIAQNEKIYIMINIAISSMICYLLE
jgi:hypothetical protein